jgi:hypothetical protein
MSDICRYYELVTLIFQKIDKTETFVLWIDYLTQYFLSSTVFLNIFSYTKETKKDSKLQKIE